ncbi:GNAT family N-acetyltransferase [Rhizobium sp. BK251]|uniref:GNAT family N-acetyltransferase n=1 Tax=Rhizobium sp. BK251 TaxID=2512125 RepID=UPI0010520578|nr:GNAT family N-acetyltransferase [Rhizobium sp. BK251]TCL73127.1 aminoglycoside 6'-N-acetyltransferase [Rhizobium sp. BK251]
MSRAERIAFRPAARADLGLLAEWLETPHVRRWWGDPAEAIASIDEHLDGYQVEAFMVALDGKDFAFIQSADLGKEEDQALADQPAATFGIDQFIGPVSMTGRGYGPAFMRLFCTRLFDRGARRILVDPHPENAIAIRAYAKAGFAELGEATTNYGRALLMALDRQEK